MKLKLASAACCLATLAGCGGRAVEPPSAATSALTPMDWRKVATAEDRARLRGWREAWITALGKVRATPDAAKLTEQGTLFQPDLALDGAAPPPGNYRCRVFKLGANGTAMSEFTAYPFFQCRIEDQGGVAGFYKTSGSQRPVGLVFNESPSRQIFLGTLMLGDETSAIQYGMDADRDMVGVVERIGPNRWRLVFPYPRFESILDVIELVPDNG